MAPDWLLAGLVGTPHGLDGSFRVNAAVPDLLTDGAEIRVGDRPCRITRRAGHDRRVILRVEGCEDRTAAEALRGTELRAPRTSAPALEDDEWWAEDLAGCAVLDGPHAVGTVTRLLGMPSCELLEVERAGGGEPLLVPLIGDAVRTVDIAARRIDIDLAFLGEDTPSPERPEGV